MSKSILATPASGKIYRRRTRLLKLLNTGDMKVETLAKSIGVSKSTIKNDIAALDVERRVRIVSNVVCLIK